MVHSTASATSAGASTTTLILHIAATAVATVVSRGSRRAPCSTVLVVPAARSTTPRTACLATASVHLVSTLLLVLGSSRSTAVLMILVAMGPMVWSRLVKLLTIIAAIHRYVVVINTAAWHTARRRTTAISTTPVTSLHHPAIIVHTRSPTVRTVMAPMYMMMTTASILSVLLKLFKFTLFTLELFALGLKGLSECR